MRTISKIIVASVLALSSAQSLAALRPGEGVVRDPVTGNYTAQFWLKDGEDGQMITAQLKTATKTEPTILSKNKLIENWIIRYTYTLSNGSKAKQPIEDVMFRGLPPKANILNSLVITGSDNSNLIEFFESSLAVPNNQWYGSGARHQEELIIGWHYSADSFDPQLGLQPGASLKGFGFNSIDLPGVWIAQIVGNVGYHHFQPLYENDSDVDELMSEIEYNDFVPRNVAAPMISVSAPFDPAIVMENIRTHVATWPGKQLAEAAFAAQLDLNLQAAANAYRTNQPEAAKGYIEILLDMIRRDHKDIDREDDEDNDGKNDSQKTNTQHLTIDRLAARVLDFDLKYVLKRMRHEGEENDGKKSKDKESRKER
ncbi:MAG: hypothetical protein PHQ60_09515 [Sideroxydans sp.]|nr:hypothetical protein [Sideroxydans sp.]